MYDEWDKFPDVPPPCYPIDFGRQISPTLSEEEAVIESRKIEELGERIRADYDRRLNESNRQWKRKRVELVKAKIELILQCQNCQDTPSRERRSNSQGCVYLMWCPSISVYKIGKTNELNRRIIELRQEVDRAIELRTCYLTTISPPLLEMAIHCHFRHFHFASDVSNELFMLPEKEVEGFEATATEIERHLFSVEIMHLKIRLSEFETDVKKSEDKIVEAVQKSVQ